MSASHNAIFLLNPISLGCIESPGREFGYTKRTSLYFSSYIIITLVITATFACDIGSGLFS